MSFGIALSLFEKGHYPFGAYPKNACSSVLFPGCSMTSQFPRTTDALVGLCRRMGMGVAYDCCAMAVASSGKAERADRILARIRERLERVGCTEVVLACPNCYAHMAGKLGIRCISIYEKLLQWQEGPQAGRLAGLLGEERPHLHGALFTPCPDRARRVWESQVRMLMDMGEVERLCGVPCCGLKPEIAEKGAPIVRRLDEAIFAKAAGRVLYTTCASCAGQFARMGYAGQVRHVLGAYLGVDEAPDCVHAIPNRARRKFDRNLEPLEERR